MTLAHWPLTISYTVAVLVLVALLTIVEHA